MGNTVGGSGALKTVVAALFVAVALLLGLLVLPGKSGAQGTLPPFLLP